MPIYEYKCEDCGEHCEKLEKVSDTPNTECPSCKKNKLKRQVSAAAFHLKGSGWYVTDFRDKDKKKPDNKQGGTTESPKKETATTSTDTKKPEKKETTSKGSNKSEKKD